MMQTYEDVMTAHRVEIPAHLEEQAEVPVLSGMQRQGDLLIIPARPGKDRGVEVPGEGVAVIRGEAGGNTHLLVGEAFWRPVPGNDQTLGTVTVPDGGTAYLLHPEHGAQGFAPGCYLVRRQREQADEIRMVAD
jgi:hypothetical protein